MSSHVAQSKMRFSKLMFIALVALYLVFMNVSAQLQDEVPVDAEGDAVAPGAQPVEAGNEIGESQAAPDIVRSQMATSRGPSRSQGPSKSKKSNKTKIAIAIVLIVLLLAVAGAAIGWFVVRPKVNSYRNELLVERMKPGLPSDVHFKKAKYGDDKVEHEYVTGPNTWWRQLVAARTFDELKKSDIVTARPFGFWVNTKGVENQEKILKVIGKTIPPKTENKEDFFTKSISAAFASHYIGRAEGRGIYFIDTKKIPSHVTPPVPAKTKEDEALAAAAESPAT